MFLGGVLYNPADQKLFMMDHETALRVTAFIESHITATLLRNIQLHYRGMYIFPPIIVVNTFSRSWYEISIR